jgi:hypothetical protein
MKNILFTLLITGIAFGANAQTKGAKPVARKPVTETQKPAPKVAISSKDSVGNVKFKETTHDFGKIPQGIPVTYTFKFVNNNPSAVTVTEANASCGCTTPNWSKEPIASGGTGMITVSYNASSVGFFNKSVTVTTNLGQVTLFITGVVEAQPSEPEPTPIKIGG